MQFLQAIARKLLSRTMLGIVLALLCIDLLLEGFGLPAKFRYGLCTMASHYGADLRIGQLCVGIFRGLVLRGVSVKLQTPGGVLYMSADDIVADFSPIGLLSSDSPLEKINAKNFTVELLSHQEKQLFELNTDELSFLTPEDAKGHLDFTSTLNGIRFNCSADILHLNQFVPMLKSLNGPSTLETTGRNPALCKALESISESMRQMDFIREDTSITLEIVLDCESPADYLIDGSFSLSDAILNDVVISRLRGKLAYRDGKASFEELMLLLSTGDILRANADFNTANKTLNCELDGTLAPTTIAKLLQTKSDANEQKLDTNGQLKWLDKPCHWHGILKNYPLDGSTTSTNMAWQLSQLELGTLPIDKVNFDLSYQEGIVGIHKIEVASKNNLSIEGNAEYNLNEKTISTDLHVTINQANLLQTLRLELPDRFLPGQESTLSFNLSLPKSPLSPKHWNLTSDFSLDLQRLAYWDIFNLSGHIELNQGRLKLYGINCEIDYYSEKRNQRHKSQNPFLDFFLHEPPEDMRSPHQAESAANYSLVSFDLEVDLNNLLNGDKDKPLVVTNSLSITSPTDDSRQEILSWNGNVIISEHFSSIEVNGGGTTFADAVYNTLLKDSKIIGIDYFAPFASDKTPQSFTVKIPSFLLNAPQKMVLDMTINGTDCSFGTFHAQNASAHLLLDAERLRFTEIKGDISEKHKTNMQIEIQFQPFFLKITDLYLNEDPLIAQDFIMANEAKQIYQQIWQDFVWDKKAMPEIHIPLIYYTSNDLGSDWEFKLDGKITATTATYREQQLKNLSCNIALSLPGDLVLNPIHVTVDNANLEGECTFHFVGSYPCFFKVTSSNAPTADTAGSKKDDNPSQENNTQEATPANGENNTQPTDSVNIANNENDTSIRPASILSLLNPELKNSLKTLSFQKDTRFSCTGSFFLLGAPSLEVKGNIESPQCSFHDWTFNDLKGNWIYENNQAFWNTEKATFMGGEFKTTGVHNIVTRTTDLVCVGKDMSWEAFMQRVFKDKKEEYNNVPGKFNITCNLQVKQDWAGHPYQLGGDGHFSLREADIWQMPLMKQLSYLVEVTTFKLFSPNRGKNSNTFGSISALKANVEFHGPRVVVTDFNTNGTIIALSGAGEYNIYNDNVHFEVNGSPLKEVTILSTLLKPLSWCFNAELQGKRSEAKWKMKTALSKIFSTDD